MNKTPDQENQQKIYHLIFKNPGIHLSKIAELLDMKIPEIESHIHHLEQRKKIFISQKSGYKQYYITEASAETREQRSRITQRQIYTILTKKPGLYPSELAEMLHMSVQLTKYHLLRLEKKGDIIAIKEPGAYHTRYYTKEEKIDSQEKRIIKSISKKIPLEIVLLLIKYENLTHKKIYEKLDISPSNLSYHLSMLLKQGIVTVQSHGTEKGFSLNNREKIIQIYKKYELHLGLHLALDRFKDIWIDMNIR